MNDTPWRIGARWKLKIGTFHLFNMEIDDEEEVVITNMCTYSLWFLSKYTNQKRKIDKMQFIELFEPIE